METIIKPFQAGISAQLIDHYKGDTPFSSYFSEQCKLHKNWGSRDRKIYRQACYAYLRLGFALKEGSTESNIRFALQKPEEILNQIKIRDIYPNQEFVSKQIDAEEWTKSLLYQKPVYLVIVKGHEKNVSAFLEERGIIFEKINKQTLKVNANTNCNELTEKGWVWIMDSSSQKVADMIQIKAHDRVWDCCSGAGGKALYMTNAHSFPLNLTCSDARFSILENLKERFNACGLQLPSIELCDLNTPFQLNEKYDTIVADVPCSGSGTWGRTPENITRTNLEKIIFYAKLQRTITDNAIKNLAKGGTLYYITCSVFKEENELNVTYFEKKSGLKLLSQNYINAHGVESDWLFCAELVKL